MVVHAAALRCAALHCSAATAAPAANDTTRHNLLDTGSALAATERSLRFNFAAPRFSVGPAQALLEHTDAFCLWRMDDVA